MGVLITVSTCIFEYESIAHRCSFSRSIICNLPDLTGQEWWRFSPSVSLAAVHHMRLRLKNLPVYTNALLAKYVGKVYMIRIPHQYVLPV